MMKHIFGLTVMILALSLLPSLFRLYVETVEIPGIEDRLASNAKAFHRGQYTSAVPKEAPQEYLTVILRKDPQETTETYYLRDGTIAEIHSRNGVLTMTRWDYRGRIIPRAPSMIALFLVIGITIKRAVRTGHWFSPQRLWESRMTPFEKWGYIYALVAFACSPLLLFL